MRYSIFVFFLFSLQLHARSMPVNFLPGTDTAKHQHPYSGYIMADGAYGTGNVYDGRLTANLNWKKFSLGFGGVLRNVSSNGYYFLGETYYQTFSPGFYSGYPGPFFTGNLAPAKICRFARQGSASVNYRPVKNLELSLSYSYRLSADTLNFSMHDLRFTGAEMRDLFSAHSGNQWSEGQELVFQTKYTKGVDNSIFELQSDLHFTNFSETIRSVYNSVPVPGKWGAGISEENSGSYTKTSLTTTVKFGSIRIPWFYRKEYEGIKRTTKNIRAWFGYGITATNENSFSAQQVTHVPYTGTATVDELRNFLQSRDHLDQVANAGVTIPRVINRKNFSLQVGLSGGYARYHMQQDANVPVGFAPDAAVNSVVEQKTYAVNLGMYYKTVSFYLEPGYVQFAERNYDGPLVRRQKFRVNSGYRLYLKNFGTVEFTSETTLPEPLYTFPATDFSTPVQLIIGNPNQEIEVRRNLDIESGFLRKPGKTLDSTHYHFAFSMTADLSQAKNAQQWMATIDSAGIFTLTSVTVPQSWYGNFEFGISRPVSKWFGISILPGYEASRRDHVVNNKIYTAVLEELKMELQLGLHWKKIEWTTGVTETFDQLQFDNKQNSARHFRALYLDSKLKLNEKGRLSGTVQFAYVTLYGAPGFPGKQRPFLSASSQYRLLEKQSLYAGLIVYDLFDRNMLLMRNGTADLVQQTTGFAPGRFFMISISYGFWKPGS